MCVCVRTRGVRRTFVGTSRAHASRLFVRPRSRARRRRHMTGALPPSHLRAERLRRDGTSNKTNALRRRVRTTSTKASYPLIKSRSPRNESGQGACPAKTAQVFCSRWGGRVAGTEKRVRASAKGDRRGIGESEAAPPARNPQAWHCRSDALTAHHLSPCSFSHAIVARRRPRPAQVRLQSKPTPGPEPLAARRRGKIASLIRRPLGLHLPPQASQAAQMATTIRCMNSGDPKGCRSWQAHLVW